MPNQRIFACFVMALLFLLCLGLHDAASIITLQLWSEFTSALHRMQLSLFFASQPLRSLRFLHRGDSNPAFILTHRHRAKQNLPVTTATNKILARIVRRRPREEGIVRFFPRVLGAPLCSTAAHTHSLAYAEAPQSLGTLHEVLVSSEVASPCTRQVENQQRDGEGCSKMANGEVAYSLV